MAKAEFLKSLVSDLKTIGIKTGSHRRGKTLSFRYEPDSFDPSTAIDLMKQERRRRLSDASSFIQQMEESNVMSLVADGQAICTAKIAPSLQFCETRTERQIFRYFSLAQSVPASRLLYRQVAAIVRDGGHEGAPVIGIIGLASSLYSLGCRDRLFHWVGPQMQRLKKKGLKSCMHLAVCMAIPPYSYLRAGRLVASLAATTAVADEFTRRYSYGNHRAELRAIITTCASGIHGAIFNRIMVRRGGLYKRIGETTGYSTLFFSRETLAAARRLVVANDRATSDTTDRHIRTLKRALNICGVPRERLLKMGMPKGVYVAVADEESIQLLRGSGRRCPPAWPTVEEAVSYWKTRDLPKALAKEANLQSLKDFRSEQIFEVH